MNVAEMCKSLISQSKIRQKDIAEKMNKTSQSLSNKFNRNTLSAEEFVKIIKLLGYEIAIKNPSTGEEIHTYQQGVGKRIQMTVNGVKYDTFKANAICHSNENDVIFSELYQDRDGRFFVAQYANWKGGRCSISPIGEDDAKILIEKYRQ